MNEINMKKCYKILYILSILLLVLFIVMTIIDYINYNPIVTSAPFYVNILVRMLEFILPSIICFIVGIICKKKCVK